MLAAKKEDFYSSISQYISVQISIFLLRQSALITNQLWILWQYFQIRTSQHKITISIITMGKKKSQY